MNRNKISFYIAAALFLGVIAFIAISLISLCTVPDLDVSDGTYYAIILLAIGVALLMGFHIGKAYQEMVDEENQEVYEEWLQEYYRSLYTTKEDELSE